MKKTASIIILALTSGMYLSSCGGGGVSEEFTKEINEFETAWTNTGTSFMGIVDSVKTTKAQWDVMATEMKVPDTLVERIGNDRMKVLDSVKTICGSQNESCAAILKGLEDYKLTWDNDTKAFGEWKDKVLKGEIDVETAKKDLAAYKTKLADAGTKSSDAYNKLSELKVACSGNCSQYNEMITKFSAEEPEPKKKGK